MADVKPLSRSEREALIKDKAGWVITVLAALLAINTLMGGSNSSKVLNNTIDANNTWAFYQAKSIKQTLAEQSYEDAVRNKDTKKAEVYQAKIDRPPGKPPTGGSNVKPPPNQENGKKLFIIFCHSRLTMIPEDMHIPVESDAKIRASQKVVRFVQIRRYFGRSEIGG